MTARAWILGALFAVAAAFSACGDEPEPARPGGAANYDANGALIGPAPAHAGRRPNLVVILIDTLRADATGPAARGFRGMRYPSAVAKGGVTFEDACAPAPWTVPSVASLLTGLLPSEHGCDAPLQAPRLVDAVTTFAEVLRSGYGYETAACMAGPWYSEKESVLQGFTHVRHPYALRGTKSILASFAQGRDKAKPFFLLLHSYEAHDPYGAENHPFPVLPVRPDRARTRALRELDQPWQIARRVLLSRNDRKTLYDLHGPGLTRDVVRYTHDGYGRQPRPALAEELRGAYLDGVRALDDPLQATVEQLAAWGLLGEDTVLVITSDHGESFGEHGVLTHGGQLYDEHLHIPLVMAGPAPFDGGRVIPGGVGLVDVLPTFLDFAGCAPLTGIRGRSFLERLREARPGRPVFAEEIRNRDNTGTDTRQMLTSVRSERWKYIVTLDELAGTVVEEAYDLEADPRERTDLCKGSGRIDGLVFDEAFCAAVEAARDRIWGAAATNDRVHSTPYGAGRAQVTSQRPAPCSAGR